jgi:hypothetical protein
MGPWGPRGSRQVGGASIHVYVYMQIHIYIYKHIYIVHQVLPYLCLPPGPWGGGRGGKRRKGVKHNKAVFLLYPLYSPAHPHPTLNPTPNPNPAPTPTPQGGKQKQRTNYKSKLARLFLSGPTNSFCCRGFVFEHQSGPEVPGSLAPGARVPCARASAPRRHLSTTSPYMTRVHTTSRYTTRAGPWAPGP